MPGLKELRILRDKIRVREDELRDLRKRRDKMAVDLANRNWPERVIGEHAGLSGPYVNALKKRATRKKVKI